MRRVVLSWFEADDDLLEDQPTLLSARLSTEASLLPSAAAPWHVLPGHCMMFFVPYAFLLVFALRSCACHC
jgi:hypothetical protein